MAMICFGSFWLVVMPQLRGPQMYPTGLRGGFCPPSYRQQVSEQIFPACSPCLFLWFKLLIRFFFSPYAVTWRGDRANPMSGGSTVEGCWR